MKHSLIILALALPCGPALAQSYPDLPNLAAERQTVCEAASRQIALATHRYAEALDAQSTCRSQLGPSGASSCGEATRPHLDAAHTAITRAGDIRRALQCPAAG